MFIFYINCHLSFKKEHPKDPEDLIAVEPIAMRNLFLHQWFRIFLQVDVRIEKKKRNENCPRRNLFAYFSWRRKKIARRIAVRHFEFKRRRRDKHSRFHRDYEIPPGVAASSLGEYNLAINLRAFALSHDPLSPLSFPRASFPPTKKQVINTCGQIASAIWHLPSSKVQRPNNNQGEECAACRRARVARNPSCYAHRRPLCRRSSENLAWYIVRTIFRNCHVT